MNRKRNNRPVQIVIPERNESEKKDFEVVEKNKINQKHNKNNKIARSC